MKKSILIFLACLFTIGSLVSVGLIIKYDSEPPEVQGDWPDKDIDELIKDSDLIAIVKVKDKKMKEGEKEAGLKRQYSTLKIKEVIKGKPGKDIILSQALNFVDKGKEYLMFLSKDSDGYYYELTNVSIVPKKNRKFKSKIKGLQGTFYEIELINKVKEKVK
ncbi:MAG: hypothetical protein H0Z32_05075 [Bacillaceae bacterium]|nr:hypothetical protein [Bacillaceae bacterium]